MVTGKRAHVSPGCACGSKVARAAGAQNLRFTCSADSSTSLWMAWWLTGSAEPAAASCSFLPVWPEGSEVVFVVHLTLLNASELNWAMSVKRFCEGDDIFQHYWGFVLSTYLLQQDSRLVPKAEETNLNFLQLAYSWVPCVSKTCLIMWLPDVFFTSCTTSTDLTPAHFHQNEWESPFLVVALPLAAACRRCWINSLCVNSVWRLASNMVELSKPCPAPELNAKGQVKMLLRSVGICSDQRCLGCGLWNILCLTSVCMLSGHWLNCCGTLCIHIV